MSVANGRGQPDKWIFKTKCSPFIGFFQSRNMLVLFNSTDVVSDIGMHALV
jgi:hypothetical protein